MQYIRSRIEDIKSLSLEDKLILFVAFALFFADVCIYDLHRKRNYLCSF